MHDEAPPTSSQSAGVCVLVTPGREPVPRALEEALRGHNATLHHAPSVYHAIVEITAQADATRCTLLIVEPARCARADALALAAMAHAPDVAVWRYDPDDDAPVAPYVPDKPGVVPDPIDDADEDEDEDDDPAPSPPGNQHLRIAGDEIEPTDQQHSDDTPDVAPNADDNTPLVSSDELSMLLGGFDDDPEDRR
ncbi:MAG: hypothetical protein Tsb0013_24860 [Phycisphaerales bacterium]